MIFNWLVSNLDTQQKLSNFYDVVTGEVKKKRNDIFGQLVSDVRECFSAEFLSDSKVALQKLSVQKSSLNQKKDMEISAVLSDARKSSFCLRNKLYEQLFEKIESMLRDFVKSSDYEKHMALEIEKIKSEFDDFVLEFSCDDAKTAETLSKRFSFKFFVSEDDFIGGCRVYLNDSRVLIDKSFSVRFERAKLGFNKFKLPNM